METVRKNYPDGKGITDRALFEAGLRTILKADYGVQHTHFLGGEQLYYAGGMIYDSLDPATPADIVAQFPLIDLANKEERRQLSIRMHNVVRAQERFAKVPIKKRAEILLAFADIVQDNLYFLAALLAAEIGKPPFKDGIGEIMEVIEFPRRIARIALEMDEESAGEIPPFKGNFHKMLRAPHGIHASIAPFNFPLAIPAHWISCPLVTGNAVILKASAHAPLCGYYLYQFWNDAFKNAGVENDGVVNFLSGDGAPLANYLLTHPDVTSYDFTGSFEAYCEIRKTIATAPKRRGGFIIECGVETAGVNPIVVCASADIEAAVAACVTSLCGSSGQKCSHLGNLLLDRTIARPFLGQLISALDDMSYGDAKVLPNFCGPLISMRNVARYEALAEKVIAEWEFLEIYRKQITPTGGFDFAPRILMAPEDMLHDEARLNAWRSTEFFAPAVSCAVFDEFDDAMRAVKAGSYKLTGSMFTKCPTEWDAFVEALPAGVIGLNAGCTGATAGMGFGGVGGTASSASGHGTASRAALEKFTSHITLSGFKPKDWISRTVR